MVLGLIAYVVGAALVFGPIVVVRRLRLGRMAYALVGLWMLFTGLPYLAVFGVPYTGWLVTAGRCGRLPAIATNFAAADSFALPGDLTYQGPGPLDSGYYCTAADAERAGYRRTPLR